MELATINFLLRDFSHSDLDAYQALRADAKYQRFYSEDDVTPERTAALLDMFIQQSRAPKRSKFQLAITTKAGVLIGSCGIRLDDTQSASIGCEVDRRWHRTRAARESVLAMMEFGFCQLGLSSIYAETIAENLAAVKLCQSVGMTLEQTRDADRSLNGRTWSTAVLAVQREDWLRA